MSLSGHDTGFTGRGRPVGTDLFARLYSFMRLRRRAGPASRRVAPARTIRENGRLFCSTADARLTAWIQKSESWMIVMNLDRFLRSQESRVPAPGRRTW